MSDKPTIKIEWESLPEMVDQAEKYLVEADFLDVYQRDGQLVRIVPVPVYQSKSDLKFLPIQGITLVELLTGIITWQEFNGKSLTNTCCPASVANAYLARGRWKVPAIRQVITAPTMREDGSILDRPGYDQETKLFFAPQGVEFPAIPGNPTKEDARLCLDAILDTVCEVPFVVHDDYGQISRAVFASAVLSALIRPILRAVPLHGINAPVAGSGKSILVDGISYLMTGNPCAPLDEGDDEIELEKRLSAALQAGEGIISFDNITQPLGGSLLCQAVSQPRLALRVLGKSELRKTTNTAMYFATGNNLTFYGDMVRRAMRCTINANCEQPEKRVFTTLRPDLAMRDQRADLVCAGLTVLRAFFAAGCPKQVEPVGTFEQWSRIVRDCLIWLGEPDPWLSSELIRGEDPTRQSITATLHAWFAAIRDEKVTAKQLIDVANKKTDAMSGKFVNDPLRDALTIVCDNELSPKKLGDWLRDNKERPLDGFIIVPAGVYSGTNRWQVVKTE